MINRDTLAKMKQGAILLNCARGGIVNEGAVCEALESGHLAAAAFDVFTTEPPIENRLMNLNNFICTPHLGASTREAQDNVAKEVAAELMTVLRPFAILLERMGSLQAQLSDSALVEVTIDYSGAITRYDVLLIHNQNVPGVIGAIASTLGQSDININRMQVGEEKEHKENVIFLSISEMINDDIIQKIKDLKHIISVRRINL
ncbi:MAG: hypothetical protein B6240_07470 [Desulfobacteraceae bacterium 4572_87]|nr:MAG: hypothetical protein B6240_07470 [Desulfobacteraceae bacterium 4572_87]